MCNTYFRFVKLLNLFDGSRFQTFLGTKALAKSIPNKKLQWYNPVENKFVLTMYFELTTVILSLLTPAVELASSKLWITYSKVLILFELWKFDYSRQLFILFSF